MICTVESDFFVLYNVFAIFCLLIVVVMLIHSRASLGNTIKNNIFRYAMISLIVFIALDILFFSMMHDFIPFNKTIAFVIKTIYYLVGTISGFLWFLYFEAELSSKVVKDKKTFILSLTLLFVNAVLLVINIWTGFIFKIKYDSVPIYTRGIGFGFIYICIYTYVLVSCIRCLIRAIDPKFYSESSRLLIYSSFPLIPLFAGVFQYNYQLLPITTCGLVFASLMIYMIDVSNQISQDSLTELNNRRTFMRVLQRSINTVEDGIDLYIFMLDLNKFKAINDNYGHVEGDRALLIFADVLKKSVSSLTKRGILARYGGDEFIIMALVENNEQLDNFINTIKNELKLANEKNNKDYKIETSIGYKKYDGKCSVKELIEMADNALYLDKEKSRRRK